LHALRGLRAARGSPVRDQVVEPAPAVLPHEDVDVALPVREQPLDQTPSDEAGCSRDEVGHRPESLQGGRGRRGVRAAPAQAPAPAPPRPSPPAKRAAPTAPSSNTSGPAFASSATASASGRPKPS